MPLVVPLYFAPPSRHSGAIKRLFLSPPYIHSPTLGGSGPDRQATGNGPAQGHRRSTSPVGLPVDPGGAAGGITRSPPNPSGARGTLTWVFLLFPQPPIYPLRLIGGRPLRGAALTWRNKRASAGPPPASGPQRDPGAREPPCVEAARRCSCRKEDPARLRRAAFGWMGERPVPPSGHGCPPRPSFSREGCQNSLKQQWNRAALAL